MARESSIIIAKNIKLDNTYKNVLSYNQTQMLNLVNTNKVASATNYSFIRQEQNMVQVGFAYSTICDANYMAFQNKDYNNKWFFAFIKDIQYVSNSCVNIIFDIDVWSTFYSDLTINKCFVEREHVNDDTIGLHTVPENLNVGDVVCTDEQYDASIGASFYIGVFTDWLPKAGGQGSGDQFSGVAVYDRCVNGHALLLFKLAIDPNRDQTTHVLDPDDYDTHDPDIFDLSDYIQITNHDGHIEDIKDLFIIPAGAIDENDLTIITCPRATISKITFYYTIKQGFVPTTYTVSIPKVTSFTGITIQNNKCYCYPYNYLLVTNNQGNQNIYKYEFFSNSTNATFETQLAKSIGISGRVIPTNYLGCEYNNDEALPLGKFPTCGWTADSFTNWLTQQAVNLPTKLVGTGAGVVMASAMYGPAGGAIAGLGTIIDLIGGFRNESLKANIEGGGNTGDIVYSSLHNTFVYKCMRAKKEDIEIIDKFFTRFGYKINETKTPNLTGRTYWNYIKIGGNDRFATGNIQTKFLDTINQIANQGVTIWHNHANIGNFALTNSIVTP